MKKLKKLKEEIKRIKSKGYVKVVKNGDGDVGTTFEYELGISENNSKEPDWHGDIEIKTKKENSNCKTTCFSKNPEWGSMRPKDIIEEYGLHRGDGKIRLNSALKVGTESSHGISLVIKKDVLFVIGREENVLGKLSLIEIEKGFKKKLDKLLFVTAETKKINGETHCHFNKATLCSGISLDKVINLLESGELVYEFRMSYTPKTGKVRDRGACFRLRENKILDLYDKIEVLL